MNRICSEVEMASAGGQFGAHSSAVEPPAHNRSVPGSNPGGPTINKTRTDAVINCQTPRVKDIS